VGQFAIRSTEVSHLALIEEWMLAPRFREDKLRGHDAKEKWRTTKMKAW
jgi:hypothetical protein